MEGGLEIAAKPVCNLNMLVLVIDSVETRLIKLTIYISHQGCPEPIKANFLRDLMSFFISKMTASSNGTGPG